MSSLPPYHLAPAMPGSIAVPVQLSHVPAALGSVRPFLTHSGITVGRYCLLHAAGIMLPVTAGLLLYGWRALGLIVILCASAVLTVLLLRIINGQGRNLRLPHVMHMATILSLMLPAHLLADGRNLSSILPASLWATIPAAGVLLVLLIRFLGSSCIHPALAAYMCLLPALGPCMVPHWILQRNHLFSGDLVNAKTTTGPVEIGDGWVHMPVAAGSDSLCMEAVSERLWLYSGHLDKSWSSLVNSLTPLEDLIIGGQPGPIGTTSAIAVIIGGLFLIYRGVIDYRIPLLIILTAMASFLILPVPVGISTTKVQWTWLAMHRAAVGPALALTFSDYEILAGPMLFTAFFLATASAIRPMTRRGRVIYAVLLGILVAICQLYLSVAYGPYLALLAVGLLTPLMDRTFRTHSLLVAS